MEHQSLQSVAYIEGVVHRRKVAEVDLRNLSEGLEVRKTETDGLEHGGYTELLLRAAVNTGYADV